MCESLKVFSFCPSFVIYRLIIGYLNWGLNTESFLFVIAVCFRLYFFAFFLVCYVYVKRNH